MAFFLLSFIHIDAQEDKPLEAQAEETIEATIRLEASSDLVQVSAIVYNKQGYNQGLRSILTVNIASSAEGEPNNIDRLENSFVVDPLEKKIITETSFPANIEEQIILLFLIYDTDDKVVGRDRIVLNERKNKNTGTGLELQKQFLEKLAETNQKSEEEQRDGISLTGLVFEETRTKPGQDFYKAFYSKYLNLNLEGPENVLVREVIATGRNTRIEVLVGRQLVWQFFSRPQSDYLSANADRAIQRVNYRFNQLKKSNISTGY